MSRRDSKDSLSSGTYEVESMGERRATALGVEVLVKWVGFTEKSWEPLSGVAHVRCASAASAGSLGAVCSECMSGGNDEASV